MNRYFLAVFFFVCFSFNTTANTNMQLVSYFEIPVEDMARAKRFYEQVFGYRLRQQEIDGIEMALFPDAQSGAITGALANGESYIPGKQGARLYFKVTNIDVILHKVNEAGGELHYAKTDIGELGFVAEFLDSEGNIIALHQDKEQ